MSARETDEAVQIESFRLETGHGEISISSFCPLIAPGSDLAIIIPPFAEEMNKSRRMLALAARTLARSGFQTLLVDLFGTGDSDGDFSDARVELWRADLHACAQWAVARGQAIRAVLGLRLGGILALDFAAGLNSIDQVLLWHPTLAGADAVTELLRLRVAASRMSGQGKLETVSELRQQLESGRSVEIAGYELHSELASGLSQLRLADYRLAPGQALHWFHVAADSSLPIPESLRLTAERLSPGAASVTMTPVAGDRFWSTVEISLSKSLLDATKAAFT